MAAKYLEKEFEMPYVDKHQWELLKQHIVFEKLQNIVKRI